MPLTHLMDPAAPPWQALTTCPDWTDGRLEAPSPSPAVRYAVRQRMALQSISGGPGAIADLSPYALKSSPRRSECTEDSATVHAVHAVHADPGHSETFAFPNQHTQGWPVALNDANKIAESGFLPSADTAQIRKGLANLMPKAKGGLKPGNSSREFETAQAYTAAYTTWGLDDEVVEISDRQIAIDARPLDSISAPMAVTTTFENYAPVQPAIIQPDMIQPGMIQPAMEPDVVQPDIARLDKESALETFNGPGVEINQTIDWTGKRTKIQTAAFGVLTESWTPSVNGTMLYDMVLQDELRRELHSANIDATGLHTLVRTIYTDENGKKNHIVAQKVVTKSDGSQSVVMYG
jgi:hypothetical protein